MSDTPRQPAHATPGDKPAPQSGRAKAMAAAAFRADTVPGSKPGISAADDSQATSVAARIIAAQMLQAPPAGGGGPVDAAPLQRPIATRNLPASAAANGPALPKPSQKAATKVQALGKKPAAQPGKTSAAKESAGKAAALPSVPGPKLPASKSRLRLLPMVIFVAVLMLGARASDMIRTVQETGGLAGLLHLPLGSTAEAQAQPATPSAKPTTPDPNLLPQTMQDTLRRQQDAAEGPEDRIGVFVGAPEEFQRRLSERRAELDKRERDLNEKTALITAAEQRLDQKIAELQALRQEIEKAMATQAQAKANEQTQEITRLVAIYEGMKPQQAAAIFNELELPVLVSVTERMKEKILSEVLARMAPAKAMELTTSLASRKKQPPAPATN